MEELVNKLKNVSKLSELDGLDNIDRNELLFAILKSDRYSLLRNMDFRINLDDSASLEKLVDYLLSDEDILYYMHKNGFAFSMEELNHIFEIICKKHYNSFKFDHFFRDFFNDEKVLDDFVKEHAAFFKNYIQTTDGFSAFSLRRCESFTNLVLKEDNPEFICELENYSVSNLKLLVKFLKRNKVVSSYVGNVMFAEHLFELKDSLSFLEFCTLLDLFKEPSDYNRKVRNSEFKSFDILIKDNIDFLISVVSETKRIPKCLLVSDIFREECLNKGRVDLASKCLFPVDIVKDEELVKAYCEELDITLKDFYDRYKWLLSYYEKNNNIFNTFLSSLFRDNLFNLNIEHFERFINDIDIQVLLLRLNNKELALLSKILDIYDYCDYEISYMIVNILNNISDYSELINTLDLDEITDYDVRMITAVFQNSGNPYRINNLQLLRDYNNIKRRYFEDTMSDNLNDKKNSLLMTLFNINLSEAKYIDSKYSHNEKNINILSVLRDSELPIVIYNYLILINRIINSSSLDELTKIYHNLDNTDFYNFEVPLEIYLRSVYAKLYSKSLFKTYEKQNIYGPLDSVFGSVNYNGEDVSICIPREGFSFLVHCVDTGSLESENINYRNDWMDMPQLQDHFVACSYINEKSVHSIRANNAIIFGFDNLDGGSILAMGNGDIDSIGTYSRSYNGARELQGGSEGITRYYVPSELLKYANNGYNEIVIERRNINKSKGDDLKRKPDYIIMMTDSTEDGSLRLLSDLFEHELAFISKEDASFIQNISYSHYCGYKFDLSSLLKKYRSIITEEVMEKNTSFDTLINEYIELIQKSKYLEACLKAAKDFKVPLIIIDRGYYFNKLLCESGVYDEETKRKALDYYFKTYDTDRFWLFYKVSLGKNISSVINPKKKENCTIEITV